MILINGLFKPSKSLTELWTHKAIKKNLDYLHYNPVESGAVEEPHHYLYSSAIDYA